MSTKVFKSYWSLIIFQKIFDIKEKMKTNMLTICLQKNDEKDKAITAKAKTE